MTDIKRYDITQGLFENDPAFMQATPNGDWIRFEDIEPLRETMKAGFLTVSSGGHEFANVTIKFWNTKEAQDFHSALLALTQQVAA